MQMLVQPEPLQHRFRQLLPQSAHQQGAAAVAFEPGARRSRARSAILWMNFTVQTLLVGGRPGLGFTPRRLSTGRGLRPVR